MKKTFTLAYIIFTTTVLAADVSMCGARPNVLSRFFTDAEKIRVKCINDAFDLEKKLRDDEVQKLDIIQKKLDLDIKKVAYKSTLTILLCDNEDHTWPKNKIEECHRLNEQRNAVISRIDHLMGWDIPMKSSLKSSPESIQNNQVEVPCPSAEELQKIQGIRYFDKKAYKTWERCVNLRQ